MKKIILGILFIFFSTSCAKEHSLIINIAGSDTLLELVQVQAETFYHKKNLPVNVSGGGSGVGINLVMSSSIDIANSSREMTKEEFKDDLAQIPIAKDLLAIVVSKSNPTHNITKAVLKKIYMGEITNWKELGWKDMPISIYGRQSSSGTYQFFQEAILDKQNYTASIKEMTGNAQVIQSLEQDEAGIAYVGFGYLKSKKEAIHLLSLDGITPSLTLGKDSSKYHLFRELYQIYHKNSPKIEAIKGWFSFILSKEGQDIVLEMGSLPLSEKEAKTYKKEIGIV